MLTAGKFIAGVVEVDYFFQALKVTIVRIGLDEIGTRPLVYVPQCGDLELAVELRSESRPVGIRVEPRIPKEVAHALVHKCCARRVGGESVSVRLIIVEIWNRWISGDTKIG